MREQNLSGRRERRRVDRTRSVLAAGAATVIGLTACGTDAPTMPAILTGDLEPPYVAAWEIIDPATVELTFSEPVDVYHALILPAEDADAIWAAQHAAGEARSGAAAEHDVQTVVRVHAARPMDPGVRYLVDAIVSDGVGNMSTFTMPIWGPNDAVPPIWINEVVCEGSGQRTDWVELAVGADGNVGGVTLYDGTPGAWDDRIILPPIDVVAGDFIVIHFKPEGIPEEVNETTDRTASGGSNATMAGWDLWVAEGDGLPNSTGALSLALNPHGPIVDALLWSTRTADPLDARRGFSTAEQLAQFEEVAAAGVWPIAGSVITPDDSFRAEASTATRSIARVPGASAGVGAWYITPTGGATPGGENTVERYDG